MNKLYEKYMNEGKYEGDIDRYFSQIWKTILGYIEDGEKDWKRDKIKDSKDNLSMAETLIKKLKDQLK